MVVNNIGFDKYNCLLNKIWLARFILKLDYVLKISIA